MHTMSLLLCDCGRWHVPESLGEVSISGATHRRGATCDLQPTPAPQPLEERVAALETVVSDLMRRMGP